MGIIFEVPIEEVFAASKKGISSTYYDSKKNQTKTETHDSSYSKRCWHDHHSLPSEGGLSMPVRKIFSKKGEEIQAMGKFCSFECMLSYVTLETRPLMRDSLGYITEMLLEHHPEIDITSINPAPPFESLEAYGGNLTIDEFRKGSHRMKKTCHFIVLSQSLEVKD